MDDFTFHQRYVVLDKPEYLFEIDEYRRGQDTFLLAHLRVFEWTPRVFKAILSEWRLFRQCVTAPLFATAEVDDEKWERFVSLLGFRFLHDVLCDNGDQRRLFIHAVQPPAAENFDHACLAPAEPQPSLPRTRTTTRPRPHGPPKQAH